MDVTSKQELTVNGMTCSHCAQTLTTVLSALSGVENVDVDVTSGRVILDVAHPLSTNALTQTTGDGSAAGLIGQIAGLALFAWLTLRVFTRGGYGRQRIDLIQHTSAPKERGTR